MAVVVSLHDNELVGFRVHVDRDFAFGSLTELAHEDVTIIDVSPIASPDWMLR